MYKLPMLTRTRSPFAATSGPIPEKAREFQTHRFNSVTVATFGCKRPGLQL